MCWFYMGIAQTALDPLPSVKRANVETKVPQTILASLYSARGKIKAVCCDLGHCSLLFISDPNAVYLPPNNVHLLQGSFLRLSLLLLLIFAATPPFKPEKNNT